MVIVMKPGVSQENIHALVDALERDHGVTVGITNGVGCSILGLVGDTAHIDMDKLTMNDDVERVMRVQEPYKKANRKFHPEDTVVDVSGVPIGGGGRFTVIAGPCSVESEDQIVGVARDVKAAGAALLRGGAFKPRTSPYSFQGMGADGLELLLEARADTGLPIVSEIMAPRDCGLFEEKVDLVQIGARNMQNFDLLKEAGKLSKPILLKRGLSNTYEEWIMSAEYIMASGNENVILCERGVRTFESYTRNTLDLSAIPAIRRMSHLPIVVDPSHAAGMYWMVEPLAMAAGLATLSVLRHSDYSALERRVDAFVAELESILRGKGVPVQIPHIASMFTVYFTDAPLRDFSCVQAANTDLFESFYKQMREKNIFLAPSAFEANMVSFAHSDEDFEAALDAARSVCF